MYTYEDFENISSWWELRDFCEEVGYYPDSIDLDYIFDNDTLIERVVDYARDCQWEDVQYLLSNINWNGDHDEVYYDRDSAPVELDDRDFEAAKGEVLSNMHDDAVYLEGEDGYTDEDNEDEEIEDEPEVAAPNVIYTPSVSKRGLYGRIAIDGSTDTFGEEYTIDTSGFMIMIGGDGSV